LSTPSTKNGSYKAEAEKRHRSGHTWFLIFQAATIVAVIALLALLLNIINSSFGLVLFEDKNPRENFTEAGVALADLPQEALVAIFANNVSDGLYTRYDREEAFTQRSQANVYDLVIDFVIVPEIKDQWSLADSFLKRADIIAYALETFPQGHLEFTSWIDWDFVTSPQSSFVELAGVRTAIFGSLWTIAIAILFAFPIGVGAAIYLEEYASDNLFSRIVQTNINNLAGVPSIIYGILGLAIFVRALEPITSGSFFGLTDPLTANGRTILSAGLTLGLLVLPLIIINAQEAIKAVPSSLKQASSGLGATRWQTIWHHVLPGALPGILTGTILSISRAIGETAPMVVIGASTFIQVDPNGPFSKFTTLPIQIFQWTARPQEVFRNLASAASLTLLILLLTMNASAIFLRNRYGKR
jgi:phosphate transport system permease protein